MFQAAIAPSLCRSSDSHRKALQARAEAGRLGRHRPAQPLDDPAHRVVVLGLVLQLAGQRRHMRALEGHASDTGPLTLIVVAALQAPLALAVTRLSRG
jgi:hypothetical protein